MVMFVFISHLRTKKKDGKVFLIPTTFLFLLHNGLQEVYRCFQAISLNQYQRLKLFISED
jgi:hypothetical protein